MISIAPVRILFLVVSFILINHSSQQELFEDALKQETVAPQLDTSLYSNIDEGDTERPYEQYIPARDEEPETEEEQQEQEDEDADENAQRRADGNEDSKSSLEVPAFNEEEENEDEDGDEEDSRAPYDDVERNIEENAKKRSNLDKFEQQTDKLKKKLKSTQKKNKTKSSLGKEKASEKSKVQKRNIKKAERKESAKTGTSKITREEDTESGSSGISSGKGSADITDESSGDEESSGAERERRQAFQTEDQIMKAKEKLKNAEEASDALTNIEREMGLDPSAAPGKTKNLTSALHSEIQKFKDIISTQNDEVKNSKFQKLEKLAEEDVKGANDVMKLIVELEVAKFFAKHRARKKLEVALRNKITNPPSPAQSAVPMGLGFGGMGQYQNQAGMADFMPQEQSFSDPNPYVPFADELQPPPQQAPAMPFPSVPQVPFQPSPIAPASFQPALLPSAPFQPFNPPPVRNPLDAQYQDTLPRWSPQIASFAPVTQAAQEYHPYLANPMSFAASYATPQPNPQPQLQPNVANKPTIGKPAHKIVKVAPKHKVAEKKPAKAIPAQQQDNRPQSNPLKTQPQQASYLPQSSPFSGLKPLESLNPVAQPVPSFSTEMESQRAPFSSYTQNPFAVSSSHPYSDALAPPPPHPSTQAFYPQSSWASPPPQVNRFSDSLSHLNPHYQKPAATFKPVSPPVKAGQRPHPPDLAKMLKDLARYRSRPITAQQLRPMPAVQAPELQRLHEASPPSLQTPPMYSQFDFPGQPEPAIPVQQPNTNFAPPIQPYYNPVPQSPQMPFVSPQAPMPAPLPIQDNAPPLQYSNEQKSNDEDEDEDVDPMDQQFNDNPNPQSVGLQYQGPAVYPQQQQPIPQAYNGYSAWPDNGITGNTESFSWPQNPNPQAYGYQPALSYEQIVNPLLTEALDKVHDTQKAAKVVQKIENTIGLSPPAVNHIIDDVESETQKEKMQFDQNIKTDEEEIQKDKKLMDNDKGENKEETQKKIEDEKKKLDEDKKRDEVAKTKLATIKKIEKILTIIETAKYSALKRAKEHLLKMKTEKDPQIRKRDLETLENDLKKSEANHLHRRNEINIWLKGSRNNINTSHFLEGKVKEKEGQKRSYSVFGSPSIPKLAIARFSAKVAKKSKIDSPANTVDSKEKKVKKPKIGIILMRKLLQRMNDLYDMQSKILTQLIKDHQQVKDMKERNRKKRNIHSARHRHHPHSNHHRHHHFR